MSKERLYAALLIVFLVGMLVHDLYFSDISETQEEIDNNIASMENVKNEMLSIIKQKKETLSTKMFKSCQNGVLKGCVTGCIAGGFTGGIASGVLFGIASPILVYIENYNN
jgi:hypothetical protein